MVNEFALAWPRLRPGGILIADDVDDNSAFGDFAQTVGVQPVVLREVDKLGSLGLLKRPAS